MWLETNHIDKDELSRQAGIPRNERQLNLDLQQKTIDEIYKESFLVVGKLEQKGMILNASVKSPLKNEHTVDYTTRIYEPFPKFTYLPRGREIFQRLIIRAALCNSIDELKTQREFDDERKKEEEELKKLEEDKEERLKEIYDVEKTEGVD